MKLTFLSLCCLGVIGALQPVRAEAATQVAGGGPETTLNSIWAASGYVRTLTDTVASQIDIFRFREGKNSRVWGSGMASFGNADVRNDHPSFDYSAGGYAIGYDYSRCQGGDGLLAGLALGQMFGHQNIKEMPDHPDGLVPGDRYRQISLGADLYGALLKELSSRSHLIFSLDAGFGYMENKCRHRDEWNDMSKWNTDTFVITFAASWRYELTKSLSVIPFAKASYTHSANKQKKDDDGSYCSGNHDSWDDDYNDECDEKHWDNRGKFDNLSMELGLTLEHALRFSGDRAWINSVSGSYCPDILRNDPHYTFNDTWREGDTMYESRYRGKGYSADRQAFKAVVLSRFVCGGGLSFFASYQACLRESYTEQQTSLGVSLLF